MNWTTSDLADLYRRRGEPNPVQSACGDGKPNKYGAIARHVDGIRFASTAEAVAYSVLKVLQNKKQISCLKLQPRFLLQEAFTERGKRRRKIEYVADFEFIRDRHRVVVDVKGKPTPVFLLKEKLFRAKYPDIDLQIWSAK